MDCAEEIPGGLVVARGDCAELFESAVEVLDQMARFVGVLVISALDFSVALGWDHRGFSCGAQRLDHPLVSIKGFVGEQGIGRHLRQKGVGALQIVGLARGQKERQRIAQRVDQSMDLGAQPALAAADRLVFAFFF